MALMNRTLCIIAYLFFFISGALLLFELYRFLYLNLPFLELYIEVVAWNFSPLAIGILLFGFSLQKPKVAYWSMHVFLWLLGLSLWFQQNETFSTNLTGVITTPDSLWPWMFLPIGGSLLLAVLYKPVMFLLTKMMQPGLLLKGQVKDIPLEEYQRQGEYLD